MSDYTYRENICDFDGNAIGCKKYTVPNRIVEQIRADIIDEFVKLLKEEYPIAKYPDDNGAYQNELLNNDIDDIAKRMKEDKYE